MAIVKTTLLYDPLHPLKREIWQQEINPDNLLLDYYVPAKYHHGYRYFLSGKGEIKADRLHYTYINPHGDYLCIVPDVGDPVSLICWGMAAWAAGGFWATAGAIGLFALAAVEMGVMAYSVYAAIAAKKASNSLGDSSNNYGWNGVTTATNADIPVPVIYGQCLTGGNVVNSFIVNGDTVENWFSYASTSSPINADYADHDDQYLCIMLALGEGPLTSIAGLTSDTPAKSPICGNTQGANGTSAMGGLLYINGIDISAVEDIRLWVRMGSNDQTPIPNFSTQHSITQMGIQLALCPIGSPPNPTCARPGGSTYSTHTNEYGGCDQIGIGFEIPALYNQNSDGSISSTNVHIELSYAYAANNPDPDVDADWTSFGNDFLISGQFMSPKYVIHTCQFCTPNTVTYNSDGSFNSGTPERNDWVVRLVKASGDSDSNGSRVRDIVWDYMDEVIDMYLTFPNTAYIAMILKATNQLSGTLSTIQVLVQGLPVARQWDPINNVWVYNEYSRNPIWNIHDALTNINYGIGNYISANGVNWDQAKIDAAYCDNILAIDKNVFTQQTQPASVTLNVTTSANRATISGTGFSSSWVGWYMNIYGDPNTYYIAAVANSTTMTLTQPCQTTNSGTNATIWNVNPGDVWENTNGSGIVTAYYLAEVTQLSRNVWNKYAGPTIFQCQGSSPGNPGDPAEYKGSLNDEYGQGMSNGDLWFVLNSSGVVTKIYTWHSANPGGWRPVTGANVFQQTSAPLTQSAGDYWVNRAPSTSQPPQSAYSIAIKQYYQGVTWNQITTGMADTQATRYTCDLIIDKMQGALDTLNEMSATCDASIYQSASQVLVRIDQPGSPVWSFGEGNIVKGSFGIQYLPLSSRHNDIQIQYPDSSMSGYARNIASWMDQTAIVNNVPDKRLTVFIAGCTRTSQALYLANLMLLREKYCTKVVQFDAAPNSVFCQPGDLVEVNHHIPGWSLTSGRILSAGTTGGNGWVTLDQTLNLANNAPYYTLRVQCASNNSMTDYPVNMPSGSYAPGTQIHLTGAFATTPANFDTFSARKTSLTPQLARVQSMKRNKDTSVHIEATNYDSNIYDYSSVSAGATPITTDLVNPLTTPKPPSNAQAQNIGGYQIGILISWTNSPDQSTSPTGLVDHYEIDLSTDGGATWTTAGTSKSSSYSYANVQPGQAYLFRILSVSPLNRKSSAANAPTATCTAANPALPPNVVGLELTGQGNNTVFTTIDAHFSWKELSPSTADALGETGNGAGTGSIDQYFEGYVVQISKTDGKTVLRTDYVKSPNYVYSYSNNVADNAKYGTGPQRSFIITVWEHDKFSQISANAARLIVSNPQAKSITNLVITNSNNVNAGGTYDFHRYFNWDPNSETDISGYIISMGPSPTNESNGDIILYNGPSNTFSMINTVPLPTMYNICSYFIAAYDVFDQKSLTQTKVTSYFP